MNYNYYGELLIKLANSVVFDKPIDGFPTDIDFDEFYEFCRFHNMENIAYYGLRILKVPENKIKKFEDRYEFILFNIAKQKMYTQLITDAFCADNIDYLLLKGLELAKLYPKEDMRISSDIDIYVGKNYIVCKDIMRNLGFCIDAFNAEVEDHDIYNANGVMCELHSVLIQGEYPWKKECNSITDRLLSDKNCKKNMSLEDLYLYNLCHAAKHMKFSGIGIRSYLDLMIIRNRFYKEIDWKTVSQRVKAANLSEFNSYAIKLCESWLSGTHDDDTVEKMKEYVYSSGFCGTDKQQISYEFSKRSNGSNSIFAVKVKACLEVFLAPYSDYAVKYPILKKHKALTPFYRIGRIVSAALFKRKTVNDVLSKFDDVDIDYSNKINDLKKSIGL